jgi:hypothetical protein
MSKIAGKRYSVQAPDTLELTDRAELTLNALGGSIDQKLMTMYGVVQYCCRRPHQSHWASAETLLDPKFAESFALMRTMCGKDTYADLEDKYRVEILSRIDGGLYWDKVNPARPWRNSYAPTFYGEGKNEDFCTLPGTGRLARTMMIWDELAGRPANEDQTGQLISGMLRIAVKKDDYCYYPEKGGWGEPCAYPRSGWLNTDEAKSDTEGGEGAITAMHGHQLYAAANWYASSGQGDALELARRLAKFCMLPKFWGGVPNPAGKQDNMVGHVVSCLPDPPFCAGQEQAHWHSHFHARAIALRGILEYGRLMEDERALEFVRRGYEFSLGQGIAKMGWINCYPAAMNACEGCALGDLVALGIRLSDAGVGDYWDDVDAVVRNQLIEQQYTRGDILEQIAARQTADNLKEEDIRSGKVSFDNVIARTLGSFGVGGPTSMAKPWAMHCCTSNASQGLYYAWEGIVREEADTAQVNLLLNRAGRLLDIDSYLPYEGKVVIRNKSARRIAVRIPSWAWRRELRLDVSGRPRLAQWVGNYVILEALTPGDVITITFALRESKASYTVNANSPAQQVYTCVLRGSTVVDISPRDDSPTSYPLYERKALRREAAPMKAVERFVPDRLVRGW